MASSAIAPGHSAREIAQRLPANHVYPDRIISGEVAVGAELEPRGLVVEPVGGGEHEDRHAAAGGDDAFGDLVAGGSGDVAVEDGDVVGVGSAAPERCRRHRRCLPRSLPAFTCSHVSTA
jgi:hypothetical protein